MSAALHAEFKDFRSVFADVVANLGNDPLLHVLAFTYEFDASRLLKLACGRPLEGDLDLRRSSLQLLCRVRPVVIYDARKTTEFSELPQFLELHPVHAGAFACHHSKAYLLVTRARVLLVLGSFNLTHAGLFNNRECFDVFEWSNESQGKLGLLRDWIEFLEERREECAHSVESAIVEILATLRTRLSHWGAGSDRDGVRLLTSGYAPGKDGLSQLRKAWDETWPGVEPREVFAVSPFFDHAPAHGSLARELRERFPSMQSMTLVTDESNLGLLGQNHFAGIGQALHLIPAELSSQERKRIVIPSGKGMAENVVVKRDLHAKILLLRNGGQGLLYWGSANFTRKAWGAPGVPANRELGAVRPLVDADRWEKTILTHLYCDARNRFDELPTAAPAREPVSEEEGYEEMEGFPDFIDWIRLERAGEMCEVEFVFQLREGAVGRLEEYAIAWGQLELVCSGLRSRPISQDVFRRLLLGGRTLSFRPHRFPERRYWFPFQYGEELVAQRETYLHPTSWDWLLFQLQASRDEILAFGESLPGEEMADDISVNGADDVGREANPVVRMQRYLTLFDRVERRYLELIGELDKVPEAEIGRYLEHEVAGALATFLRLLAWEFDSRADSQTESLFKVGELARFLSSAAMNASSAACEALAPLRKGAIDLLSRIGCSDSRQKAYVNFIAETIR